MARSPSVTGSVVTSGGDSIVEPPASTSEAVASGGSPAAKTFSAFTDADGTITNYAASVVNAVGSTSVSGSGLGPYTLSGSADGDSFALKLDARNASNEVLATAVHSVDIAAAAAGATPDTFLDISGVSSYNFLTTGGTGGSGGEGNHTVAGLTWAVSYDGTSGPTRLEILSGVLYFEGTAATNRANIHVNMQTAGAQLGRFPMLAIVTVDGVSSSQPLNWAITQNGSGNNQGNEAQFLLGTRGNGTADNTSLLTRENTTSSPAFTTVKAWDFVLGNITGTQTRMACRMMGGSWQPSWDQGSSALPTNLANLTNHGAKQYNDFANASTPQNRQYFLLKFREDCDVRMVCYKGSTS